MGKWDGLYKKKKPARFDLDNYVETMWGNLAATAYLNYLMYGRSLLHASVHLATKTGQALEVPIGYIKASSAQLKPGGMFGYDAPRWVASYEPESQIVFGATMPDRSRVAMLLTPPPGRPTPAQAYQQGLAVDDGGEQMAYHEAGHTVAAYLTGKHLAGVWISKTYGGGALYSGEVITTRQQAIEAAFVSLAGSAAEIIQYSKPYYGGRDFVEGRHVGDYATALACIKPLAEVESHPDAFLDRLMQIAVDGIRKHWAAVAAMAQELMACNQIEGSRAVEIIAGAIGEVRIEPHRILDGNV